MLTTRFGIEIEMTGITRMKASSVVKSIVGGISRYRGTTYDETVIEANDTRKWFVRRDGSITTEKKVLGTIVDASTEYSVELVSPILTYRQDIETLQEIIRALRKAGAFTNNSCGIHIHLDGQGHNARSIKNFINIIYSRNDLFYHALNVDRNRMAYCKKLDSNLVKAIKKTNANTLEQLEDIWYSGYYDRTNHYNTTRYHFLNLHSFFHGHGTVELRGFNSTLHAGEVRSYIVFALALNHQALTQKFASTTKPQIDNEKFAMRTYLNRIGFIGDEFKACREHLTKHLTGSSAWRFNNAG